MKSWIDLLRWIWRGKSHIWPVSWVSSHFVVEFKIRGMLIFCANSSERELAHKSKWSNFRSWPSARATKLNSSMIIYAKEKIFLGRPKPAVGSSPGGLSLLHFSIFQTLRLDKLENFIRWQLTSTFSTFKQSVVSQKWNFSWNFNRWLDPRRLYLLRRSQWANFVILSRSDKYRSVPESFSSVSKSFDS